MLPMCFRGNSKRGDSRQTPPAGDAGFVLLEAVVMILALAVLSFALYSLLGAVGEGAERVEASFAEWERRKSSRIENEMRVFVGNDTWAEYFGSGDEQRGR